MSCQEKILFIQFKFLGDIVFLTPILKAYKEQFPEKELHVLVPKEAVPLLSNLVFIDKVWGFPRVRGKLNLFNSIKFLMKLRSLNYEYSLDLAGNDRGSIVTRFISAKQRIGVVRFNSTLLQKFAYQIKVNIDSFAPSYIDFNKQIVQKALNFTFFKKIPKMEIRPDFSLAASTKKYFDSNFILCHVSTTQEKKQWSLDNWIIFYKLTKKYKIPLLFSAGPSVTEQSFLLQLKRRIPKANILKPINDLKIFIAFLSRASLLISNDTGPLHFAAAMNVKIIGLFGPADSVRRAAPIYTSEQKLFGKKCECINDLGRKHFCSAKIRCIDTINPIEVFDLLQKQIKKAKNFK
jgi:ADP-heptose:LPS heptosyltransferase